MVHMLSTMVANHGWPTTVPIRSNYDIIPTASTSLHKAQGGYNVMRLVAITAAVTNIVYRVHYIS